jgi:hypothetical protein
MIVFILYYALLLNIFNQTINEGALTIIYALTLLPSGNFVLSYYFHVQKYRQYMRFFSIFYQKRYVMQQVAEERLAIIKYIDHAKNVYLDAQESNPQVL